MEGVTDQGGESKSHPLRGEGENKPVNTWRNKYLTHKTEKRQFCNGKIK